MSQWIADFSSSLVKHRDMLKERVEAETEGVPSSTGPYEPPDPSSFAKPTLLKKFGPPSYNNFGTDMDPAFALSKYVNQHTIIMKNVTNICIYVMYHTCVDI